MVNKVTVQMKINTMVNTVTVQMNTINTHRKNNLNCSQSGYLEVKSSTLTKEFAPAHDKGVGESG